MRVQLQNDTPTERFAKQLLDIGNDMMAIDKSTQCITSPTKFCKMSSTTDELIPMVFPNIARNYQSLNARAILAATNNHVNTINFSIRNKIPGKIVNYPTDS